MTELINVVYDNLIMVLGGMGIFVAFWLSNFVMSIYHNTKVLEEVFEWRKMFGGILKLLCICIGSALFTIGVSVLPSYMKWTGLEIPQEYVDVVGVLAIIIVYVSASLYYAKQCIATLKNIFNPEVNNLIDEFEDVIEVEYGKGTDIDTKDIEAEAEEDSDFDDIDVKSIEVTD